MTRPFALATTLACVLVLGIGAAPAQAWSVNTRIWLKPQITYRADGPQAWEAANYAAWVWRRAGARFVPVHRGADLNVIATGRCGGDATVGHRRGAYVRIGRCALGSRALVAVHEFGHVLGLAHEDRYCSRMNSVVRRDGTPARCPRHPVSYWVRHPLERDDIAGARWILSEAARLRRQASRR